MKIRTQEQRECESYYGHNLLIRVLFERPLKPVKKVTINGVLCRIEVSKEKFREGGKLLIPENCPASFASLSAPGFGAADSYWTGLKRFSEAIGADVENLEESDFAFVPEKEI